MHIGLVLAACVVSLAVGHGTAAAAPGEDATSPSRHRAPGKAIDDDVRRMTKKLDLSPDQQARLRIILIDERLQIHRLWSENPDPAADRVGPTTAIIDRTRGQIRAMLTAEQKGKYPADLPRDKLAPAGADIDSWLQKVHRAPGQPPEPPK